jgi:hypothetical protein
MSCGQVPAARACFFRANLPKSLLRSPAAPLPKADVMAAAMCVTSRALVIPALGAGIKALVQD